ncbi:transglycosylase domain-containing protein [Myroides odoratimimus]|uniref:Penicillin-insensitive transglycosylase n=1 Tax=Myroides odoratimimus CIP 101113 TaxID=883154 RepID=A0AAV3F4C7_9FLAO|nr:transglycosylase domain-containing protein [Myroides odoratimimus]EHO13227.1 hypothetical protein HMPREF9715_01382 [Myroides odoratimimus CIP 101113]
MNDSIEGFVIYNKDKRNKPIGVISNSIECKASINKVPNRIKDFLVPIEDKRFFTHSGIDLKAIIRAFKQNLKYAQIVEGGSTITQQLSRNLLKDNSKTLKRKVIESYKAILLEKIYSKNEILDLYFDNIYFGKNIFGLRTASLVYFDKEPNYLSLNEIVFLLAILRGPNFYLCNTHKTYERIDLINQILLKNNLISNGQFQKIKQSKFKTLPAKNYLKNIPSNVIPFITNKLDFSNKIVFSSLENNYQKLADDLIKDASFDLSVIIIKNKKVVGVASSFGISHSFIHKSNVGSTLKPFLYYYARKEGISPEEKYLAQENNLNWNVNEINKYKEELTLKEALYESNNNVFINVAEKLGMDSTLEYLVDLLKLEPNLSFPSLILGATKNGISLYELAMVYNEFFNDNLDDEKLELKSILNFIFNSKFGLNIDNALLKTGTTNNDEELYALINSADTTYAFLKSNKTKLDNKQKDQGLISFIKKIFINKKASSWIL